MSAASGDDDEDARHTALFDPDTVFPVTGIGGDNVPDVLKKKSVSQPGTAADGVEAEKLYARRESVRVAPKLTPETVKRIADRAERKTERKD